ncbi:MAG: hypothetical protein B6D77_03470 [gamma proteobacterium symbiont of Ctena orbiculata]|nr:MAG: hypothetical protein B6D77_03470 [gamma proteobacterium symbiont of Ctena orbiculata]
MTQLFADFPLDGLIGARVVTYYHQIACMVIHLNQQLEVRCYFLVFDNSRDISSLDTLQGTQIVDTGKKHRGTRKQGRDMLRDETEGIVVGDIDGGWLEFPVFYLEVVCVRCNVFGGQGEPLGIEIFGLDHQFTSMVLFQDLQESVVLTLGPGILLAVGVDDQDTGILSSLHR